MSNPCEWKKKQKHSWYSPISVVNFITFCYTSTLQNINTMKIFNDILISKWGQYVFHPLTLGALNIFEKTDVRIKICGNRLLYWNDTNQNVIQVHGQHLIWNFIKIQLPVTHKNSDSWTWPSHNAFMLYTSCLPQNA